MFANEKTLARRLTLCLALITVTLALYWPVLRHAFVNLDDPVYVTENARVQEGFSWPAVTWAFRTGYAANWHPLTWLSHMLDCRLYGLRPWGHHLANVLFHLANTVLLFGLLKRMTGAPRRSAFVAALFAWHPLHVESVAWVAERKDLLSAFFGLLAAGAYFTYGTRQRKPGQCAWPFYLLSLLFFALGLMSKPMLVTWPFVLLLLDYWPLRRFASKSLLSLIWEKLPFLALSVAASVVTLLVQRQQGAVVPTEVLPPSGRMLNALLAYAGYLGKMFWPVQLAVFYPFQRPSSSGPAILSGAVLAAITVAALRWRSKRPWLLVGWFWFLGTLVPVIGLVQVGGQAMADRYTYLPLVGLFIVVAWGGAELLGRQGDGGRGLAGAGAVVLLLCLGLTHRQLSYWKNSETLFRHTLAVATESPLAHGNLGAELAKLGKVSEAEAEFSAALRLQTDYYPALYALGNLLRTNGSPDAALALFNRALAVRPDDAKRQYNHAVMLAELQKEPEAIAHYQEALRLDPNLPQAHNNLAGLLLLQGKTDEGLAHALTALRLQPDFLEAHLNAGNALFLQEEFPQAEAHYRAALKLNPNLAHAHLRLGEALINQDKIPAAEAPLVTAARLAPADPEPLQVLAKVRAALKRPAEAVQAYRAALRLQPDWFEGINNLAWILATCSDPKLRDGAQAIELANRASAMTVGTNGTVQATLAAAYAEAGMFKEAAEAQQWAVLLSVDQTGHADPRAVQRLDLYNEGKPFREP